MTSSTADSRARPYDPAPNPGLKQSDFRKINVNGFGDGHNSYAHAMGWYQGKLYVGCTRSNMCMLKIMTAFADTEMVAWPVDCPDTLAELYQIDRRAPIWRWDPVTGVWDRVSRAPMVEGVDGQPTPREIGFRAMAVFQGTSDPGPVLYASAWAPGRAHGGLILGTDDGTEFTPRSQYGILGLPIQTTRLLIPFKGRLFFSPTARKGKTGGQQNTADLPIVYESADPISGVWTEANPPAFGEPGNKGIFAMCALDDYLYAGTFNLEGCQVWRSRCEGEAPYQWEKVLDKGGYRGPANQCVANMKDFNGAMYLGTGIQGGGRDRVNDIGPEASELIRIWPDGSWDLLVGEVRDTPDGHKRPLSGFTAGFGNFFNGYFWVLESHDGWLYQGTYDWSINLRWVRFDAAPRQVQQLIKTIGGAERLVENQAGFDLWRTADGENWMPVSRNGFGNAYNWGVRTMKSTPMGLFLGTANVFAPRVAVPDGRGGWHYEDNPDGGCEVWLGSR